MMKRVTDREYFLCLQLFFSVSARLGIRLIVPYQQLIDNLSFLGYGAYGAENAQTMDVETLIQVIKERIGRILLTGIGVGKHSFAPVISQLPAEFRKTDLVIVIEIVRHIRGAVVGLIDGLVWRIEIKERLFSGIPACLPVVSVKDCDTLQQVVVEAYQFLFQNFGTVACSEGYGELALAVYGIDTVVTGTHEEYEQGGTGNIVRVILIELSAFLHEIGLPFRMIPKCMVFFLDGSQYLYQSFG